MRCVSVLTSSQQMSPHHKPGRLEDATPFPGVACWSVCDATATGVHQCPVLSKILSLQQQAERCTSHAFTTPACSCISRKYRYCYKTLWAVHQVYPGPAMQSSNMFKAKQVCHKERPGLLRLRKLRSPIRQLCWCMLHTQPHAACAHRRLCFLGQDTFGRRPPRPAVHAQLLLLHSCFHSRLHSCCFQITQHVR
jgi:hypothetical protein